MNALTKIYALRVALGITAAFICIAYGMATGTIYTNLVANHSLETGTVTPQDWTPTGNGTEWSTTYARTGSKSIRIDVANDSAEWTSKITPVEGENTYQISAFLTGQVTEGQFLITIKWFPDSEGLQVPQENNVGIPVDNYSRWIQAGGSFTAPTGTKSSQIVFSATNASGDMYADDLEIRQIQTESLGKFGIFANGLSLAIITYIISYYIIKQMFILKVEKPQKIFTTGIFIYFLAWAVFWFLMYSLIAGA
jgi:hypothetical protein